MLNLILLVTMLVVGFSSSSKFDEDPYWSYFKRSHISPIPQLGSPNPLVNLGKEKVMGQVKFLRSLMEQTNYKKTVFKIKSERERIVLSDPVAIRVMFDVSKIYKVPQVGPIEHNPTSTRGYLPSFLDNGKSHYQKKKRQYKQFKERLRKFGLLGIYNIMADEMTKVTPIDSQTAVNFTDSIEQVTVDTMAKFLLGKPLANVGLYQKWFPTGVKISPNLDPNAAAKEPIYKAFADEMFAYIKSTPYVQDATERQKCYKHFEGEELWFVIWQSAAGVVMAQTSLLREYYDLPKNDRKAIEKEANRFYNSLSNRLSERAARKHFQYRFKRLHIIERFVLEVVRLNAPVTAISARARRDFVITSLNGRYQIKKDDYLLGNIQNSMRNPTRFRNPSKVNIHRNAEHVKKNFFAFGGPYHQRPTLSNRKCIGQEVALGFMKMLVLQLTRCDVKLTSSNPLQVTKFVCKPNKLKACTSS